MKKNIALVAVLFGMVLSGAVSAQNKPATAEHTVTVIVSPVNLIEVAENISIELADAEIGDAVVTGSAITQLSWLTNGIDKQITVTAQNQISGVTLEVTCAGTTVDLAQGGQLRTISQESSSCDLEYGGSAPLTTAPTSDIVTVTYTLLDN